LRAEEEVVDTRLDDLLNFWFGNDPDDAAVAASQAKLWWGHDPETDADLRARFGAAAADAADGELDQWTASPRGRLAVILLLDQIPRAIHRGQPEAFAQDAKSRRIAAQGLDLGVDQILRPIDRVFLYLPFEHSEHLADQERSVQLFRELLASVAEDTREAFGLFLDYAERHREVIDRFGRFPHRNPILGRTSTPEEEAFLEQPGSSF
jgi:uncharacterized protein (DUF924 family)